MFPVLAEHEIFVINQRRQQRLDDGEHARQLRAPATDSRAPSSTGRGPARVWQGMIGVARGTVYTGGVRPIALGK